LRWLAAWQDGTDQQTNQDESKFCFHLISPSPQQEGRFQSVRSGFKKTTPDR
jgi:hypothetical protein